MIKEKCYNKRSYKLKKVNVNKCYTTGSETVIKNTESFGLIESVVKFLQPSLKYDEKLIMLTYINGKLIESVGMEVY